MGLVGHNKRFLSATVGTPGNIHDARLLRHTKVLTDIIEERILPKKTNIFIWVTWERYRF